MKPPPTSSQPSMRRSPKRVLYDSSGDQPIQVVVHLNDDWLEASVLDHGPQPPAGFPAATNTAESRAGARGVWLLRRLVAEVRLDRVRLGTRVTLRRAPGPAGDTHSPASSCHPTLGASLGS
jgi:hypothetical protein